MPDPQGELGQIGPHSDPNGDAAWLAQQASQDTQVGTVSGVSYDDMSHNPPVGGASKPSYDTYKHSGRS